MNRLLGGALALVLSAPATLAKEIAPFRAELLVRWGQGAGSDAYRDELARIVAERLATSCFSRVDVADRPSVDSGAELVYTIVLSDVIDETRFDDTIAGALQPGEPTKELRRVAYFEVGVDATLSARANGTVIHRKYFVARGERRPIYIGEDPQAFARSEATNDIVDTLSRSLGCGGTKLQRRIREALPH